MDVTGDQEAALSAVGLTELVHGIFRAQAAEQRARREGFVRLFGTDRQSPALPAGTGLDGRATLTPVAVIVVPRHEAIRPEAPESYGAARADPSCETRCGRPADKRQERMLAAGLFEYNFGDSEFLMLFLVLITLPFAAARQGDAAATRT